MFTESLIMTCLMMRCSFWPVWHHTIKFKLYNWASSLEIFEKDIMQMKIHMVKCKHKCNACRFILRVPQALIKVVLRLLCYDTLDCVLADIDLPVRTTKGKSCCGFRHLCGCVNPVYLYWLHYQAIVFLHEHVKCCICTAVFYWQWPILKVTTSFKAWKITFRQIRVLNIIPIATNDYGH